MRSICDICYSPEHDQYLDIHLPDCGSFPVLLYFHGGGLERGDKGSRKSFINHMVSHGVAVVSANYRLYPAAKYPDFIEDAAQAVDWVLKNCAAYGQVKGIYVSGSSAGAYLTMMLCFDRRWLGKHGISPMQISGFIHDSGQPTCHYNVLRERESDSRRLIADASAPLFHVGEDEQYPPMLILVSDNDMQNRYEQTILLVSTLKHFGHEAPEAAPQVLHGGHCEHVGKEDQDGNNIFGKIVCRYMSEKGAV